MPSLVMPRATLRLLPAVAGAKESVFLYSQLSIYLSALLLLSGCAFHCFCDYVSGVIGNSVTVPPEEILSGGTHCPRI